jgi:WD40 repeat protein
MNIDGTGRRRLMDDTHKDRGPLWTSDGKLLLFYSNRGGAYDIWRIRPDGTDAQRLTNSNDLIITNGIPAPDGRSFACSTAHGSGFGMMLYKPNQTLESLSAPLPVAESGVAGFMPVAFSPDGKYIAGTLGDTVNFVISVFSCETQNVTRVKAADGGIVLRTGWESFDWIDENRLIGWDRERETAYIYDVAADETREVPGIQGPCDIRVVESGQALIVNRTREESDIWMLTLGTIDNRRMANESGSAP